MKHDADDFDKQTLLHDTWHTAGLIEDAKLEEPKRPTTEVE